MAYGRRPFKRRRRFYRSKRRFGRRSFKRRYSKKRYATSYKPIYVPAKVVHEVRQSTKKQLGSFPKGGALIPWVKGNLIPGLQNVIKTGKAINWYQMKAITSGLSFISFAYKVVRSPYTLRLASIVSKLITQTGVTRKIGKFGKAMKNLWLDTIGPGRAHPDNAGLLPIIDEDILFRNDNDFIVDFEERDQLDPDTLFNPDHFKDDPYMRLKSNDWKARNDINFLLDAYNLRGVNARAHVFSDVGWSDSDLSSMYHNRDVNFQDEQLSTLRERLAYDIQQGSVTRQQAQNAIDNTGYSFQASASKTDL